MKHENAPWLVCFQVVLLSWSEKVIAVYAIAKTGSGQEATSELTVSFSFSSIAVVIVVVVVSTPAAGAALVVRRARAVDRGHGAHGGHPRGRN